MLKLREADLKAVVGVAKGVPMDYGERRHEKQTMRL
jgi:hypothetical protein